MSDSVQVLERPTRVTPFGARFWDAATRRFIGDGLQLQAFAGADTHRTPVNGFVNRSGVFLLAGLPGLRELEMGLGDSKYWAATPLLTSPPTSFRIEVTDPWGRFLPFYFDATLPVQGLFLPPCLSLSPPTSPPWDGAVHLPLFSAPARPVPGALAVVRAELHESDTNEPAAWALVNVLSDGEVLATGMSDQKGRVTVFFAYPEPKRHPRASPPQLLIESSWHITVEAFYQRRYATPDKVPETEDLCAVFAQLHARLLDSVSPPIEIPAQQLQYGRELILKSAGSPYSYLFVESA